MEHIGPAYGAALRSAVPALVAQLEERYRALDPDTAAGAVT